jgi:hypothetical protein
LAASVALGLNLEERTKELRVDPVGAIAEQAGFADGESWWEHAFERGLGTEEPFAVVSELMKTLREQFPDSTLEFDLLREAQMRIRIAEAEKDFERVAVVCGAWHVPALLGQGVSAADKALLKRLPKLKIAATWVPWTYEQLTFSPGYGAGVTSPAYYETIWHSPPDGVTHRWLIQAAQLLREEGLNASTASVVEAVRLAEALACLRGSSAPSLDDLIDSATSVLFQGERFPLDLIQRKLVVGDRLGEIPPETPSIPLQSDLLAQQRRLRLKPEAAQKTLELDLRSEIDLGRSQLLHRLNLLEIPWGVPVRVSGKLGTFHEHWQIAWQPELSIRIVLASRWGASVESASFAAAAAKAESTEHLSDLTELCTDCLTAGLTGVLAAILERVANVAAVTTSAGDLLGALPSLGWIVRYGDVRKTDVSQVRRVFDSIFVRAIIGLPSACVSLDEEASTRMSERIEQVASVVMLLEDAEQRAHWLECLGKVTDLDGASPLIVGKAVRILLDTGRMDGDEVSNRLSRAASKGTIPNDTAAWIEGFLGESAAILIHEERLWDIVNAWVAGLDEERFMEILPLIRRTFGKFSIPERRQLGGRVGGTRHESRAVGICDERARLPLALVNLILDTEFEL